MAFEYIKESELLTTYEDAKKSMLPLFEPFDEYERIARNKPHPGIKAHLPKVTDGTLAAIIQETPKRVIQQIPTGLVKSNNDWLKVVAGYIFTNEILPNANQEAAFIQKSWALISKALTYGSQPTYTQFVNRGEYFGTDFGLPYIKDVLLEPGKLSDRDSNVVYLLTWWTKNQIEAVIDKEQMLQKSAKERKEEYKSSWDLDALADLIAEKGTQKDANQQTPNEKGKNLGTSFYQIIHCFQRGVGANFYSFNPKFEAGRCLRRKVNPDPRGLIPINYMYTNIDLSNPLGRGAVELSGGMQNLIDSEVQSYQYMRALMMDPPIIKKGEWSKSQAVMAPGRIWDLGTDQGADAKPIDISTSALERFPDNYGLMKSQIINLNSSPDSSISGEVGNPGFSKTPAGVSANNERLGVSDNYLRKQYETWFEDWAETSINLYFAERSGIQELEVDDETAQKLRKIDPSTVGPNNMIRIDYDSETPNLKFQVDASSSQKKDNADQLEKATNVLELTMKYPQLDKKAGGPIDITELADRIVSMVGLEDAEKIVAKAEVDPQTGQPVGQQPQQPQITPEMVQQLVEQVIGQNLEQLKAKIEQDKSNDPNNNPIVVMLKALGIKFADLPQDTQRHVLEGIGIPGSGQTIKERELDLKASDSAVKVAGLDHQEKIADKSHMLSASDAALRVAQAGQPKEKVGASSGAK